MRRFSQRNVLVTLSDINITPLLDLAFVLLIIFMITTPLLEQSIRLNLPDGGQPPERVDPRDVATVEINARGQYRLDGRPVTLALLERQLVQARQVNPNLVVRVRTDERTVAKDFYPVIDCCTRNALNRLSLSTEPARSP